MQHEHTAWCMSQTLSSHAHVSHRIHTSHALLHITACLTDMTYTTAARRLGTSRSAASTSK